LWELTVTEVLAGYYEPDEHGRRAPESLYGSLKMWPTCTGLSSLEAITADWVHWYNTSRLMHRLDRRPPAEAEAHYYAQIRDDQPVALT
jgi:hypothetical protein